MREARRLYDFRDPAPTRPAATVLLARDGPGGLEVLMTRRSARASFAAGAHVFPGGVVDAEDGDPAVLARCRPRPDQNHDDLVHAVAGIRELFEESGILLALDADGRTVSPARVAALPREAPFHALLHAEGLRPAVEAVHWHAHWITDRDLPRRFDVRFLFARAPADQVPVACDRETFAPEWLAPGAALARHHAGELELLFPTLRTLQALGRHADVADWQAALAHAPRPRASCPRVGRLRGEEARFAEHEPPFGELELVAPDGRALHDLDWQHTRAVRLTRDVARLTASNAGPMTGPGTNSYLVGDLDGSGPLAVIDPGPDLPAHVERLAALAGARLCWILCTHSHPDHSPGAARLAARTGAVVAGMASRPGLRADWAFAPSHALACGDRITVGEADAPCTLRAVYTPGHMSNHLCFVLEEDGLLFSGDHVLNGSTTVVDPEDGDMAAYLASLRRLRAEPVRYILPGHGHVLGPAHAALDALTAHRLAREARVRAALQTAPRGLEALCETVYVDVPCALHPVAMRSLRAHLDKLVHEGQAHRDDTGWRLPA